MCKAQEKVLADTFEIKGKWFLNNENLDDSISGILRFSPKAIALELIGAFKGMNSRDLSIDAPSTTIFGISDEGECFTLFNCYLVTAQLVATGFSTVSYDVQKFYVGTQFVDSEDSLLITDVEVSFTNLNTWLRYPVIKRDRDNRAQRITNYVDLADPKLSNRQILIPSLSLLLEECFDFNMTLPKECFLDETQSMHVNRFYRLSSANKELLSPAMFFDYAHHLCRLLSLFMGIATYFSYIEFNFPDLEGVTLNGESIQIENHCRLFFVQVGNITQALHLEVSRAHAIPTRYSDVHSNMAQIFDCWFQEKHVFSEILDQFISDLYIPTYVENQFLSVVRGLESYHRYLGTIDTAEDAALEEARSNILAFIHEKTPPEFQEFFVSKVQYTGDISLRSRLNTLIKELPPELSDHLFGALTSNTRTKLIQQIIDTRNYYTHRDNIKKYPNVIESGLAVSNLTDRLASMLTFFCLTHLGIDRDIVAKRLIEWR